MIQFTEVRFWKKQNINQRVIQKILFLKLKTCFFLLLYFWLSYKSYYIINCELKINWTRRWCKTFHFRLRNSKDRNDLIYNYCRHFDSRLDILYTFIPQMLFLGCIFIYLCIEILVKWLLFSAKVSISVFRTKLFTLHVL